MTLNKSRIPIIRQNDLVNQKTIQDFNNAQIYTKGFNYNLTAGVANTNTPQLGGKARQLHGVCFFVPNANINDDDIISLVINSEQVIDNVNWKAYSPANANNQYKGAQFFPLKRALSGADDVQLVIQAVNAHRVYPVFYLSNI